MRNELKRMRITQGMALGFLGLLLFCCKEVDKKSSMPMSKRTAELPADGPPGMVWIPGGAYAMGAQPDDGEARPDEYPQHPVELSGFWMDTTEVTNAQFREFVEATGYVTTAERPVDWEEIKKQVPPGTPKPHDSILRPSSMVFTPVDTKNLADWSQWWSWVAGANWRHPQGPQSTIEDKEDHPVVQVSWDDAQAYLKWAGKRLPTDAEWEYAARGGLEGKVYPWGSDGQKLVEMANTWQGTFPLYNSEEDGYFTTAPVASYPANGYGLYDMAGNVWEWTADWYNTTYYQKSLDQGTVKDPQGAGTPFDPQQPWVPQRVQRGGSFLCSNMYCSSYRTSARMHSSQDSGQDHAGFRGVISHESWKKVKEGAN